MDYCLPPAGNGAPLRARGDLARLRAWMWPWRAHWFGSGTAAMAAVLYTLRQLRPHCPEVVFSAFNCPSLVAAARYAGCMPRLVDLAPGSARMDLEALRQTLGTSTLAIVAVDLFGLTEQRAELSELARRAGVFLVQDSAQGFPARDGEKPWYGDAVVLSFGRGKPVNVLGGGAALVRHDELAQALVRLERLPLRGGGPRYVAAAALYNLLRQPHLYPLPAALPFLHLGQTRYRPLKRLEPITSAQLTRLPAAVERHWRRGAPVEEFYRRALGREGPGWWALAPEGQGRLNRYPLLATDPAWRERLLAHGARYGMAPLYPCSLARLPGTGLSGDYPQAEACAAHLLTLPTHDGVRRRDLEALTAILGGSGAAQPQVGGRWGLG